jgi:hypothetical protein
MPLSRRIALSLRDALIQRLRQVVARILQYIIPGHPLWYADTPSIGGCRRSSRECTSQDWPILGSSVARILMETFWRGIIEKQIWVPLSRL